MHTHNVFGPDIQGLRAVAVPLVLIYQLYSADLSVPPHRWKQHWIDRSGRHGLPPRLSLFPETTGKEDSPIHPALVGDSHALQSGLQHFAKSLRRTVGDSLCSPSQPALTHLTRPNAVALEDAMALRLDTVPLIGDCVFLVAHHPRPERNPLDRLADEVSPDGDVTPPE
jgi:hypothetical protein